MVDDEHVLHPRVLYASRSIFALTYNQLLGSVQAIGFFDLVPFSHGVLPKHR